MSEPSEPSDRGERDTDRAPSPLPRSPLPRRMALGVAAFVAALLVIRLSSRHDSVGKGDRGAWAGHLTELAASGGAAFERCSPDGAVCGRLARGDSIAVGSVLRTVGTARASVELKDGTRLLFDPDTKVRLDGTAPRRARLERGTLAVETLTPGARVDTAVGHAELDVATVTFTVRDDSVEAEVARGGVRLVDDAAESVAVRSGETATLGANRPVSVFTSAELAARLDSVEHALAPTTVENASGLGEIVAKKPGEERERPGAVTLAIHSTRVHIVGAFARTEIEETFANHTDDVLEGIYRFPLPPGAQIERLALDTNGTLEEAAFVDRDRASAIWRGAIVNAGGKRTPSEQIVWVPGPWRDPALLEWQRGGHFELRIYPIPKRGSRRVVMAYTQVVPPSGSERRYVYPLPYDPSGGTRIGRFEVEISVRGNDPSAGVHSHGYPLRQERAGDGGTSMTFSADAFLPSGDLTIDYGVPSRAVTAWAYRPSPDEIAAEEAPGTQPKPKATALPIAPPLTLAPAPGSAADPYVAIALRPDLPRAERRAPQAVALVVDASRSMFGERYRRASDVAARIAGELDPDDTVIALACDATCQVQPNGAARAGAVAARGVADFLGRVTPEGASDVTASIRRGREALASEAGRGAVVIYVGDGTPTVGAIDPALVRREIGVVAANGAARVNAVAIGEGADIDTLGTIADAGGGVVVPYAPGQSATDAAYAVLAATYGGALAEPSVELPAGLSEVVPRRIPTMRAGGETLVFARMTRPVVDGTVTLRGRIGAAPFERRYPLHVEATTSKGNAFVPRLWAAQEIAELEQDVDAASRRRAVELSSRFHVASRYTSLLVLESEAMFHAFGVDRQQRIAEWTGDADATSTSTDDDPALAATDDRARSLEKASDEFSHRGRVADDDTTGASEFSAAPRSPGLAKQRARPAPRAVAAPTPAPAAAAPSFEVDESATSVAQAKGESRYAEPPPPAKAARLGTSSGSAGVLELGSPADHAAPMYPREMPRRMIPMRKTWDRVGRVVVPATLPKGVTAAAIERAEDDVRQNALSREAMKRLYTLQFLSGNVDRAGAIADGWSAKDPLDPEALTARADVAAARGKRDLAIRILGSVVDVRPGDEKAQWRLARLHRWAGRAELGCRYSMAVAQIRSTDAKLLAEAVRCARDTGHSDLADDLLAATTTKTATQAQALLASPAKDPSALSGDLRVEATWDGGDDLDLSLLPPDGNRVSWLGAPTHAVISARDVQSRMREGLALRGGLPGDYVIEVTRPFGHTGVIRGTMDITAAGERRSVPFVLEGQRLRVALAKITTKLRLVPL